MSIAAEDPLQPFLDALDARGGRAAEPEVFFELAEPLAALVAGGYPARALAEDLQRTLQEPTWLGNWKPNELVLHAGRRSELSVWSFSKPRQYLHTVAFHTLLVPCTAATLAYRRFRLPAGYDNRVFDRNLKLEVVDEGEVREGDVLCLAAGGLIYDFLIERPTPLVKFTFGPIETMEWLFHRDTGAAWKISDSDAAATQARVSAYVLGQMSHPSSAEALKETSFHPSHAVRWASIQALSRISVSDALERLRVALDDPHPHIRRAAERTLGAMQQKRSS